MLESFDRALRAARQFQEVWSTTDFGPDLRATQDDWQSWMERQCRLEGDITMGSAAGRVEAACIERLARDRAEVLEKIAKRLTF